MHFVNVLTSTPCLQKAKAKGVTFVRVVVKGLGPGRQVSKWVAFVIIMWSSVIQQTDQFYVVLSVKFFSSFSFSF